MICYDYHIHTNFSPDSSAAIESVIQQAIKKNLIEIALTDHVDLEDSLRKHIDFQHYQREFFTYKKKYEHDIQLILGVELSFTKQQFSLYEQVIKPYEFDFVICSAHSMYEKNDVYLADFFDQKEKLDAYREYFQELANRMEYFHDFSVLGHLDYVARYAPYPDTVVPFMNLLDEFDEIFRLLIEKQKGLEVNTSYFYFPTTVSFYELLLKRYKELGGTIITVGSDAHKPQDLAQNFTIANDLLQSLGYRYVCRCKKMKFSYEKI